ncbi:hypothetical protein E2562_008179 [Oryza meyeriana var. granulata]|uniref:Uncharacterized protein n=1 Tax=Oryza meyeriana var. granulata TaxID=110450 RepID=A0A6G1CFR4_9ORYZ|nr:hypothetical protein E2562_008179 [Oryza meyeriana var. granulata]
MAALEQCERDFNALVERMVNLNLDSGDDDGAAAAASDPDPPEPPAPQAAPGAEERAYYVETMLSEMSSATSMDDARERGLRVLDAFGAAVDASSRDGAAARLDAASRQSDILKRAVLFHHRLRQTQEAAQEELRRQVDDYKEQVRRLEATNYALSLHLRQADLHRGGGAMAPGPGNPEIF